MICWTERILRAQPLCDLCLEWGEKNVNAVRFAKFVTDDVILKVNKQREESVNTESLALNFDMGLFRSFRISERTALHF